MNASKIFKLISVHRRHHHRTLRTMQMHANYSDGIQSQLLERYVDKI
jgi:hypothetical protein